MIAPCQDPKWLQFRRLLLGAVVEGLVQARIEIALPSLQIVFHEESVFRVPRLDNYMRFKGSVTAELLGAPSSQIAKPLGDHLKRAWDELIGAIDLPVGDRLTSERAEIETFIRGGKLEVRFDLEAD